MVKVILQLYPQLPASRADRLARRPLGRDSELYHQTVLGMNDLARAADELGLWGISSIEHHFHSEGYEVGPNPGILNAHWAAITKRVRVGALGYVMSAQNPIRVAEEVAIIDHLTEGRCFVGFARGYQARWTNILGQHLGTRATLSPKGLSEEKLQAMTEEERKRSFSDDQINRDIFEEQVDLTMRAWADESIEATGRWEIPFPRDEGVPWGMRATQELGAVGEVDEDNNVRRVSVVPSTYTKPHPPIFVSSNASRETVEYCGPRGFIPTYFSPVSRAASYGQSYVDAAKSGGKEYTLGQNQALVRWGQIGDNRREALDAVREYDVDIFRDLYAGTTPMKFDPDAPVDSVLNSGLWLVGNVDEVRREYIDTWKQLPAEYIVLIYHYAQQPTESVIRQLELFMTHIKPALDELTPYAEHTELTAAGV